MLICIQQLRIAVFAQQLNGVSEESCKHCFHHITIIAGGNHYTGPLQCAKDIVTREGPRGLLRGWTAQYVRLGPQTTVIFVVMEELRRLANLGAL